MRPHPKKLAWDTDFWGFGVARLDIDFLRSDIVQSVLNWCKNENIRCLYFAANGSDPQTLLPARTPCI
jgi:hypothetical protein